MLAALMPLYAAGAAAKNTAYDRGWARSLALRWPVISIGNLSVGGAGKTPLVIHLAELLRAQALHVDVLTRGYGRTSTATEQVDPAGPAARYGDEPLLIANRAGVPVFVSADRYQAGLLAERNISGPAVHLLDDGFQHRRLARAVDIVVLHRSDFDERLLPAGRLREPLSSLSRATALVLREEDAALASTLARRGIHKPVWHVARTLRVPEVKGKTIAFCGIARPDEFFTALHGENVIIAEARAFRDHQPYGETEIARLAELAREHKATAFLTTEKDAARMGAALRARLAQTAPVHVTQLDLTLREEARVVSELMERVQHGRALA
jgi:tetraacyldisaccharide 4'-kinase